MTNSLPSKNVVVRYVRHPYTGEPYGVVVAVNTADGVKMGWSQRNTVDTFCKKTGRRIAIQRALFPPTVPLKPAMIKFTTYSPFTGKVIKSVKVDAISHMLESVRKFAENVAFAPEPKRPTETELPPGIYWNVDKTALVDDDGKTIARVVATETICTPGDMSCQCGIPHPIAPVPGEELL